MNDIIAFFEMFIVLLFYFVIYYYPQLRDRRAESPKAHSPGHRPVVDGGW